MTALQSLSDPQRFSSTGTQLRQQVDESVQGIFRALFLALLARVGGSEKKKFLNLFLFSAILVAFGLEPFSVPKKFPENVYLDT